jgi:hypothetical protein
MENKINPYRHRVKAFISEDGLVDYVATGGLCDPREARKRKTPDYGSGEHPREKRLEELEASSKTGVAG